MSAIRLIVNADDFGFTRDVNEGIVRAHLDGIVTAATLMANGSAFKHAVQLANKVPSLDLGCHLVLVEGQSVLDPARGLPATMTALCLRLIRGNFPVYEEMTAQVLKLIEHGIQPTHLDTHKHAHLLPPVLKALARVAREFGIRWVRRPCDFETDAAAASRRRLTAYAMRMARPLFARALQDLRTTDHFAGFQGTGSLDTARLAGILGRLPPGLTEFVCHPGLHGDELRAAATRLKQSRETEVAALTSAAARNVIERRGIELTNYRFTEY